MGEWEAIMMAAADVVGAWRRMPIISRTWTRASDPKLAQALERLDDAVGPAAWPAAGAMDDHCACCRGRMP